jgi:small subunit ribosomal protein S13e
LKAKGLAPDLPEDLYHLIKKAVSIRKHLERNRKVGVLSNISSSIFSSEIIFHFEYILNALQDRDAKFRLILVESRIHRLARYYKSKSKLAPTWK